MIYTFWEGEMSAYIKLCLKTWDIQGLEYKVLNYENLHKYTNLNISKLRSNRRFELYHIADIVRVHTLRDNGGYWIDADTIMLSDNLSDANMIGIPEKRGASIAFLHTEPQADMYIQWAKYQDDVINNLEYETTWDMVGNAFADEYTKQHDEVTIEDISKYWPEETMISYNIPRKDKYIMFYFERQFALSSIEYANMLMLHNSWTPKWYKQLSEQEVINRNCTMSNILREVTR